MFVFAINLNELDIKLCSFYMKAHTYLELIIFSKDPIVFIYLIIVPKSLWILASVTIIKMQLRQLILRVGDQKVYHKL